MESRWNKTTSEPEIKLRQEVNSGIRSQAYISSLVVEGRDKDLSDVMRIILDRKEETFVKAGNIHGDALVLAIEKDLVEFLKSEKAKKN